MGTSKSSLTLRSGRRCFAFAEPEHGNHCRRDPITIPSANSGQIAGLSVWVGFPNLIVGVTFSSFPPWKSVTHYVNRFGVWGAWRLAGTSLTDEYNCVITHIASGAGHKLAGIPPATDSRPGLGLE